MKLANALDALGVAVAGRTCLDVGASTGGFTDCLLQRGAARVIALDVAYGELDYRLRKDARVTVIERTNARSVDSLPFPPSLIVIDVSFISLRKVLPAVLALAAPEFDCLAMVKPQFEVGRDAGRQGRRGARSGAAARGGAPPWRRAATALGCAVMGFAPSGLPGPAGNLRDVRVARRGLARGRRGRRGRGARGGGRVRRASGRHRDHPPAACARPPPPCASWSPPPGAPA